MKKQKLIAVTFQKQLNQSDCGMTCLSSLIRYYGGDENIEKLRDLSGTTNEGTILLGLYQAAKLLNMDANAFEADIENLKNLEVPVILHVVINNYLNHYIICYGYKDNKFYIGDPGSGLKSYSTEELLEIWKTKTLLVLKPTKGFRKKEINDTDKYDWLLFSLKVDTGFLTIVLIMGVFISIISLSSSIFFQQLIDNILPDSDYNKLTTGLVLLTILLLAKNGISYLRSHFILMQNKEFNIRIFDKLFKSLFFLPKSFFDRRKTGDIIVRINDARRIQNTINIVVGNSALDFLMVLASVLIIFIYNIYAGWLVLISIPFFF